WVVCFQNLVDHGHYTVEIGHDLAYFGRLPGYTFFIGAFYLACGRDWERAFTCVIWSQVLLDVVCVYFVYAIARRQYPSGSTPGLAAWLYALYPFVIVWNPKIYAESVSVFFMLAALYCLSRPAFPFRYAAVGVLASVATLCRIQIIFLLPALG